MLRSELHFRAAWAVLLLFFAGVSLWAQVLPTGTIMGVVRDASGASIPKASVTVRNAESGLARMAMTGDDGAYRFPALPVGHYDVKVEMTGFNTLTQTGLTLDVAQEEAVNFTLQIGTTVQQLVVTGEAPQIDTTSSSLGHLVDDSQISELPLNGRNFVDLTLMQTGVTQFANNNFGTNGLFGVFYSANGAPLRSNMYTLDGAIMGNIQGASASSITGESLGLDGIREYKVMTNTFSAEYGLNMGSQMTIVTKGGTNQLHGDLFEYVRNSAFDARNLFDVLYSLPTTVPGGGLRIAPFRRNQFGGSVGGPIRKNKTFFFATYEGFREVYANPPNVGITPTIPAACHTPIVNGVETVTNSCDPALKAGQAENVAPVMQPLLALWPLPNVEPGDEFTYLATERTHEDYVQGRVDHNFSSADSLFVRYTLDNANENYPKIFPQFDFGLVERQQYVTLSENHIFSSALLNSARFSFSRSHILDATPSSSNPFASTLTGPQYSCVTGRPICPINITQIANFSDTGSSALINTQNIFSVGDDVFWTKGKHGLRFGTLINHYQQFANNNVGPKGSITFGTLQSFLLGQYRNFSAPSPTNNNAKFMLFDTAGFYVEDEYRVLPRFTLNLGLRYEFNTQPTEKYGRQSFFADPPYSNTVSIGPIVGNPTHRDVSPRVGFAWDVLGNGKTSVRGGFAILYDVTDLGALFALLGGLPPYSSSVSTTNSTKTPAVITFPFPAPPAGGSLQGTSPTAVVTNYKSPHMQDFNLSVERQLPFGMALSVAYAGSHGLDLWQPANESNPFCPTSNSFVPRGCEGFTTVVANALPIWACPGTCPAGLAAAPRLNPFWSNFGLFQTAGTSWYHALEINLTKRLRHGLQFQSAYTFSKLLDDTEGISNSDTSGSQTGLIEDPFNPMFDYGPANFDIRHNWHFNALYYFPNVSTQRVVGKLLNGWWTGSIVAIHTGQPFSPLLGADREQAGLAGTNGGLERPDYVTSANLAQVTAAAQAAGVTTCPANSTSCIPYNPVVFDPKTVITGTVGQWFNPNMFALPAVGTIGDVGRNTLIGPGLATWDFSINKDTALRALGEAGKVQFRAEMFNVLNHPNFGPAQNGGFLNGSVRDTAENPVFTGIISTSTANRQIQFSLKLLF